MTYELFVVCLVQGRSKKKVSIFFFQFNKYFLSNSVVSFVTEEYKLTEIA